MSQGKTGRINGRLTTQMHHKEFTESHIAT
jgi:hypothetical protein